MVHRICKLLKQSISLSICYGDSSFLCFSTFEASFINAPSRPFLIDHACFLPCRKIEDFNEITMHFLSVIAEHVSLQGAISTTQPKPSSSNPTAFEIDKEGIICFLAMTTSGKCVLYISQFLYLSSVC